MVGYGTMEIMWMVRYALTPLARTFWKQSRQYTGFPAVGRKGTCVGWPHEEQTAS